MIFDQWNSKNEAKFRFFEAGDIDKGVFNCLSALTKAPVPPKEELAAHLEKISSLHSKIINIVGELDGEIVAFGTIIVCHTLEGKVGKIENIVTSKKVRGKGMGKVIIEVLKELGWAEQCSRITLFCEEKNVAFYRKLGFELQGEIWACYN